MLKYFKNKIKKIDLFSIEIALASICIYYLINPSYFEPYSNMLLCKGILIAVSITVLLLIGRTFSQRAKALGLYGTKNLLIGITLILIWFIITKNYNNPKINFFMLSFFVSGIYYVVHNISIFINSLYSILKKEEPQIDKVRFMVELIAFISSALSIVTFIMTIIK